MKNLNPTRYFHQKNLLLLFSLYVVAFSDPLINCRLYSEGLAFIRKTVSLTELTLNYVLGRSVDLAIAACSISEDQFKTSTYMYPRKENIQSPNSFLYETDTVRRHSGWTQVNVIILAGGHNLEELFLTKATRERDYNFVLNLNPALDSARAVMLHGALAPIKFKILLSHEPSLNRSQLRFTSVCFYCANGQPTLVDVPVATQFLELSSLFTDFTRNFHGKSLAAVGGKGIPVLNNFVRDPVNGLVPVGGFQVPIVLSIQRYLNFTMSVSQDTFGKPMSNGAIDGIIGKVASAQADLGFGAVFTWERSHVVHFLTPNTYQFITFVTNLPTLKNKWQAIFRSFTLRAWTAIGATIIFLVWPAYALAVAINFDPRHDVSAKYNFLPGIREGWALIFQSLLEQSHAKGRIRSNASAAFIFVSWMFSSIVIGTAYKSVLMSNMVTPLTQEVPESFEALAGAKGYKIYVHHDGGVLHKLFSTSMSRSYLEIYRKSIPEPSITKCIEFAHKSNAACFSYRDNVWGEVNRNFVDRYGNLIVKRTRAKAFHLPVAIFVPQLAVYKTSMDTVVRRQNDMGLTEKYISQSLDTALAEGKSLAREKHMEMVNTFEEKPEDQKLIVLNLEHFASSFALLALGSGLAFGVLCGELSVR